MSTQPEALRLADLLDAYHTGVTAVASAELRRLQGLLDECAIYLKEGETPAQRIARDHGDSITLMTLLAREKRKSEALLEALRPFAGADLTSPTVRDTFGFDVLHARAAIAAVEQAKAEKEGGL